MNKTTVFVVCLCFAVGLILVLFFNFNPITAMTSVIEDPLGSVEALPTLLVSHWQTLTAGFSGVAGTLALVSRAYSRTKEKATEAQNLMQDQLLEADRAKAKVEGQVEAQELIITNQTEQLENKETEIRDLNQKILDQQNQIDRLNRDDRHITKEQEDKLYNRVIKEVRKP